MPKQMTTKPTPPGWPRVSVSLYYEQAAAAIDWLCETFGFEVRLKVEHDGRIAHSELTYGEGLVMVSEAISPEKGRDWQKSPRQLGGANTQNIMVFVDDADAHCAHARAAGAVITEEPVTNDYGEDYWTDRSYGCLDLEGHHWWFCQRLRGPKTAS